MWTKCEHNESSAKINLKWENRPAVLIKLERFENLGYGQDTSKYAQ